MQSRLVRFPGPGAGRGVSDYTCACYEPSELLAWLTAVLALVNRMQVAVINAAAVAHNNNKNNLATGAKATNGNTTNSIGTTAQLAVTVGDRREKGSEQHKDKGLATRPRSPLSKLLAIGQGLGQGLGSKANKISNKIKGSGGGGTVHLPSSLRSLQVLMLHRSCTFSPPLFFFPFLSSPCFIKLFSLHNSFSPS